MRNKIAFSLLGAHLLVTATGAGVLLATGTILADGTVPAAVAKSIMNERPLAGVTYAIADVGGPPEYVDLPQTYSGPAKHRPLLEDLIAAETARAGHSHVHAERGHDAADHVHIGDEIFPVAGEMALFGAVGQREPADIDANIDFLDNMARHADYERAYKDKQTICLAHNIYHEAAGEMLAGIVAVANVTLNRVASPQFPNTICDVVYQRDESRARHQCEFSWVCGHAPANKNSRQWNFVMDVATKAVLGDFERWNLNKNVMWYHKTVRFSTWHSQNLYEVGRLGHHTFYADVKS